MTMKEQCPNVYFEITPTISVFSVHTLYEFHRSWVEDKLLDIDNIRVNILTHPRHFSITILPTEVKSRIEGQYMGYIEWLKDNKANNNTINAVKGIIDYMNSEDHSNLIPTFKKEIQTIDNVRNESFLEIYPEFNIL
jgi:hypothetical protein